MNKLKLFIVGIVLSILIGTYFTFKPPTITAQIPAGMPHDIIGRIDSVIYIPDGMYIAYGDDYDVLATWNNTDGWLTKGKRTSLFWDAPITQGYHDPTLAAEYFDEFFTIDTTGGMGNKFSNNVGEEANLVIDDADTTGGILLIQVVQATPGANGDSILNYQLAGESFATDTAGAGGRRLWFEINTKFNDTTNCSYVFGMFDQDDDSLRNDEASDGIYFEKPAGGNTVYFRCRESDNLTTSRTMDMVTPTELYRKWVRWSFYSNGTGSVTPWAEGVAIDSAIAINVPWNTGLTPSVEVGSCSLRVDDLRIIQEK